MPDLGILLLKAAALLAIALAVALALPAGNAPSNSLTASHVPR